ncbi:hydroxymethylglutaryl-CoA lyase [Halobacteriovorax sp. HLS]|uniref:hydroxymethylglutaryl-CoA lyase n=1 Tax=Halobacteriovorax sp. HLS TaxID=2234000 RepID=UPI000FD729FA|nr:hydroxymethylglutaryl-CoA lyase [Halobacteriovorax sp. HLS]
MLSNLPKSARIIEVGPRDGLQNEATILSWKEKLQFIDMLVAAGLKSIEITSFVRSSKIPQMGDAKELFEAVSKKDYFSSISTPCLVPNMKGMENALALGVKEIAIFTSTSNTFNQKNINATIEESIERFEPVVKAATQNGIKIRGYVSTVFGCPYEGETSIETLKFLLKKLQEFGCYEVSLGDTIGVANPLQTKKILEQIQDEIEFDKVAMHFHDTRGMALANILSSLEMGITNFDSSAGGLGGCPYAVGSSGNVATEDVVYLLHSMGIETGIDMKKLSQASELILGKLKKQSPSKFLNTYLVSGK